MDFKTLQINKAKWWQEIKSLEQEYKRNISQIQQLEERQSDISFEVQKRLENIQKESEKYDQYCYDNKLGEFSE
jgi:DNA anti-recombination protein RmuC